MIKNSSIGVIIVAGGSGSRFGGETPKQFLPLCGKPVLAYTLERFSAALPGADIVVALPAEHIAEWRRIAADHGVVAAHRVCEGGAERFYSVKNALMLLGESEIIMVHDAVRPLVTGAVIKRGIETSLRHGTAIPVVTPADSYRILDADGSRPLDRRLLRAVQTPQVFRGDILRRAYNTSYLPGFTDDASVVEQDGTRVTLFEGDPVNIKITLPADLMVAECVARGQSAENMI